MRCSLVWLVIAIGSLFSVPAPAADKAPPPPLAAGEYLLVFEMEGNLKPLTVSIRKEAAGKLSISSPAAPLSPSAIFQRGELFQFSLLTVTSHNPDSGMEGETFEGFMFVGSIRNFEGEKFYRGTFAAVVANTAGSTSPGTFNSEFILYPMPAKP